MEAERERGERCIKKVVWKLLKGTQGMVEGEEMDFEEDFKSGV